MFCAFSRAASVLTLWMVSRLISVGKVTGCTIRSSIYGMGKSFFLSSELPDRPEREADHSPASSAEFNSEWRKAPFLHGQHSVHRALWGVSISTVNRLVFVMESYCVFFTVRTEYLCTTCRTILVFEVVLCPLVRCPPVRCPPVGCPPVVMSTCNTVPAHTDRHV